MDYAVSNMSAMPFGNLLGGPLRSAIEAQALAARTTIEFIKAVGFTGPANASDNSYGEVRKITFKYESDENGDRINKSLTVPILTVIPIPFIRIEEMTLDFTVNISEQIAYSRKSNFMGEQEFNVAANFGYRAWYSPISFDLSANYSYRSRATEEAASQSKYQTDMNMNIIIKAVQDEMPQGLAKILGHLNNAILAEKNESHTKYACVGKNFYLPEGANNCPHCGESVFDPPGELTANHTAYQ